MQIEIKVTGNIAEVVSKPEVITTGTVGLPVLFTFDESWEGLQKTAVFRCGKISRVKPEIDTATTVPREVLKKPNTQLSIGVYGVNAAGTIAIPTVWANVDTVKPGADPEAEPDTDPALPVYQQLLNDTKELRESLEWLEADTANELKELKTSVADLIREANATNEKVDALQDNVAKLEMISREELQLVKEDINILSARVYNLEISGGGGSGGGLAPLIVEIDETGTRVTHTAAQINEHAEAGGDVWFEDSGNRIALTSCTTEVACFSNVGTNYSLVAYVVYDDATYGYIEDTLASADEVAEIDDTTVGSDAWSSKKTVDTLCPDFTESGYAVRREIVEGYPLTVVASEEATKITRCGKNIFDISTARVYHNNSSQPTADMYVTETGLRIESIKDFASSSSVWGFRIGTPQELAGKTITVSGDVISTITGSRLPIVVISATDVEPTAVREKPRYADGGYVGSSGQKITLAEGINLSGRASATYTVTGEESKPYIAILFYLTMGGAGVVGDWTEWRDIQVEIGDKATPYEPYVGDTFTPGEQILALKGVNSLYADNGKITVSGKASPAEIFETVENITKTYELIEDFTLAEDATSITRNTDPNGNPYDFSAVRIFVETAPIEGVTNGQVIFSLKDASQKAMIFHQMNSGITNAARRTSLVARNDCGLIEYYAINAGGESFGNVISKPAYNGITPWRNVCSIGLSTYSAPHYPAGTRIVIYAIRR